MAKMDANIGQTLPDVGDDRPDCIEGYSNKMRSAPASQSNRCP